jgi:hypothetical protein
MVFAYLIHTCITIISRNVCMKLSASSLEPLQGLMPCLMCGCFSISWRRSIMSQTVLSSYQGFFTNNQTVELFINICNNWNKVQWILS